MEEGRLAGVTALRLSGRGPPQAFVFDPHRLALPCWALALEGRGPALLITLDRHLDLVPPHVPVPEASAGLRALDEAARWTLDVRNVDHVLAAMEAGLVRDALVLARSRPAGCLEGDVFTDRRGRRHRVLNAPTVDRVAEGFGTPSATPAGQALAALLDEPGPVLLDVDLDCFTTPSDADPTSVVPWPLELIRSHLLPPGSGPFWDAVLPRTVALTVAREPYHCGGLLPAARLFESLAHVLFVDLLRGDLP